VEPVELVGYDDMSHLTFSFVSFSDFVMWRISFAFVILFSFSFEFEKNRDIEVAGVEPGTYEALDKVMVKMENGEVRPNRSRK